MSSVTLFEQKWQAIAPKPFSLLSILGSGYILQHIFRKKERRTQVYHRILIGLSIYDIIMSFTFVWGTWAVPIGTPEVYLASGTQQTCNAQAFLQQLGVATPIYTAELAIYYFLVISAGWKEERLKKIEIIFHIIPTFLAFTSSIVGIVTNSFESSILWCWYGPDYGAYRFGFFYGPLWFCIVLVCILMCAIYVKVLMQERRVKKYQHHQHTVINVGETTESAATTESKKKKEKESKKASASKRIAEQAIFYSGSFFITWLFPTWARIYEMVNPGKEAPFAIIILFTILTPLQGLFNVFVYFRPKYLHYKHQHPDFSICRFIFHRGTMRKSSLVSRSNTNPADINESERSYMRRFMSRISSKRLFNPRRSVNTNKTSSKSPKIDESATINNQTITLIENEDHHAHHDRKSKVSFADDVNNIDEEEKVEETADAVP